MNMLFVQPQMGASLTRTLCKGLMTGRQSYTNLGMNSHVDPAASDLIRVA